MQNSRYYAVIDDTDWRGVFQLVHVAAENAALTHARAYRDPAGNSGRDEQVIRIKNNGQGSKPEGTVAVEIRCRQKIGFNGTAFYKRNECGRVDKNISSDRIYRGNKNDHWQNILSVFDQVNPGISEKM